jgi:hypothetical protein
MFGDYQRYYVREQSLGEIIRNTFEIYRDFFSDFFLIYLLIVGLPTFLWKYLNFLMSPVHDATIMHWRMNFNLETSLAGWIYITIFLFTTMLTSAVITIMVSETCLGNYPQARRAFSHISTKLLGKLLVTYLIYGLFSIGLFWIAFVTGLFEWALRSIMGLFTNVNYYLARAISPFLFRAIILLLIVWFMFYPLIVVLEGRWGFNAFRRSLKLVWGYYARNYAAQFVLLFLTYAASLIIGIVLGAMSGLVESAAGIAIIGLIVDLVQFIIAPLNLICLVLLYYDLRVRKESYDLAALAEDLRH